MPTRIRGGPGVIMRLKPPIQGTRSSLAPPGRRPPLTPGKIHPGPFHWSRRIKATPADLFGILARLWPMLSGPVTALLIASCFTRELQGYYYTFGSLLAIQTFFDLGFGNVIARFASHEWSRLYLNERGRISGDPASLSRLAGLGRLLFKWYAAAGTLVAVGLGLLGHLFFSVSPNPGIRWLLPWWTLCPLTGLYLCLGAALYLLDGCNQVDQTYAYRFYLAVLQSLALWSVLLLGAGLWTPSFVAAGTVVMSAVFLWKKYRHFFQSLLSPAKSHPIDWRRQIWPMQWKIALIWTNGYLIFSLFTPVLFRFHGPAAAGQMGMTWSLIYTLSMLSYTAISTKIPHWGILAARKNYRELDDLFFRSLLQSLVVMLLGALLVEGGIILLNRLQPPLAMRLLSPLPAGMLLLGAIFNHITVSLSACLQAHKEAPFWATTSAGGLLAVFLTLFLGSRYGAHGVALGFLIVQLAMLMPNAVIFLRSRAAWLASPAPFPEFV